MASGSQLYLTSTKQFVDLFQRLGINLSDDNVTRRSSLRSYLIVIAGVIQMFLSIGLSIKQWNYINIRVAAFTKFGEYSICTLAFGYLVLYPEHCVELFKLTDVPLGRFVKNWNHEQQSVRNDANIRAKTVQKLYLAAGVTLWFFTNFVPCLFESCIVMIKPLEDIEENDVFFLFYFKPYFTKRTTIIYCVVSLLQSILYLAMIATTSLHYSVVTSAIKMLEAEVKVLCIVINDLGKEMSDLMLIDAQHSYSLVYKSNRKSLKESFIDIIKHHQAIIGAVEKLNHVAGFLLTAFNGVITMQLSLELYCTLETDEPWMHFSRIPGSVICYGVLCFLGQGLINEGNNLKQSLDWFPWIETPQWFKKSLLVMVTCTKKPLEIRPSGLYVLNSSNWMSVIQAAYSYLNMMRSFKANRGL